MKLYKQKTISPAFLGRGEERKRKKKVKSVPLFSRGVNFVIKLWLTPHKYTAALVLQKDCSDYFLENTVILKTKPCVYVCTDKKTGSNKPAHSQRLFAITLLQHKSQVRSLIKCTSLLNDITLYLVIACFIKQKYNMPLSMAFRVIKQDINIFWTTIGLYATLL